MYNLYMRRRVSERTSKQRKIRVSRRITKMKCQRVTRKNSKLPPFNAATCFGQVKKGKDGMYMSSESKNGVLIWKKVNSSQRK